MSPTRIPEAPGALEHPDDAIIKTARSHDPRTWCINFVVAVSKGVYFHILTPNFNLCGNHPAEVPAFSTPLGSILTSPVTLAPSTIAILGVRMSPAMTAVA
jgi:hypothetical protein